MVELFDLSLDLFVRGELGLALIFEALLLFDVRFAGVAAGLHPEGGGAALVLSFEGVQVEVETVFKLLELLELLVDLIEVLASFGFREAFGLYVGGDFAEVVLVLGWGLHDEPSFCDPPLMFT
jgi:hypothetical protein